MRASLVKSIGSPDRIVEELKKASDRIGAVCLFLGVVRSTSPLGRVVRLEYEAHEKLAEETLRKILKEVCEAHGVIDGVIEHKVGRASVGEPVMCVAVASEHREEAFRAVRELVERVKAETPIWKKEVAEAGERWVEETRREPLLLRLRGLIEVEVHEPMTARELVERLGMKPGEVLVMRKRAVLRWDDLLGEGDLVKVVPPDLATAGG